MMLSTPHALSIDRHDRADTDFPMLDADERHSLRHEGVLLRKGRHHSGAWLVGYLWRDHYYCGWTRRPGGKIFAARRVRDDGAFEEGFDQRLGQEYPDKSAIPAPFDGQRKKIYMWEQQELEQLLSPMDVACLPEDELEELAEQAFKLFDMAEKPQIRISSEFKAAMAIQPNIIQIPDHLAKAYVVLHECAHLIARDAPSHGPHFSTVYIDLLANVLGIWRSTLERSARLREIYINGSILSRDE